jgi:hypothetical protein
MLDAHRFFATIMRADRRGRHEATTASLEVRHRSKLVQRLRPRLGG